MSSEATEARSWLRPRLSHLYLVLAGILLIVYQGALSGPFVSDDFLYIVNNPYLSAVHLGYLGAIADPWGDARLFTTNYAPVHLVAHLLERVAFGNQTLGWHVVNVMLHAANATMLVALLRASRVGNGAALLAGAFFAFHPACVEAVAWISQLKTQGAMALGLGALLLRTRRPLLAATLFALALLTKTSAVAVLPMAAGLAWARGEDRRSWRWLVGWAALFVAYALPQLGTYGQMASYEVAAYEDPGVHLATVVSIAGRYALMAATSLGVSAFQEPVPVTSFLDPFVLLGAVVLGLGAWRIVVGLRSRSEEAGWWLGAAAGFAPISQILPFLYPVADRYLYFILPGLLGGVLLAVRGADLPGWARGLARPAFVACVALIALFGARSFQRAHLWASETRLVAEGAANFPQGEAALYQRACRAGQAGDLPEALLLLRAAADRGVNRFDHLERDPCFGSLRREAEFQDFVDELATRWLREARERDVESQAVYRAMAKAQLVRGRPKRARRLLRRGVDLGGPLDAELKRSLRQVNDQIAAEEGRSVGDTSDVTSPGTPAPASP